jgi:hypothetical protein
MKAFDYVILIIQRVAFKVLSTLSMCLILELTMITVLQNPGVYGTGGTHYMNHFSYNALGLSMERW